MRTLLIIGLWAITLCGCTDNLLHSDIESSIIITGNTYQPLARQSQSLSFDAEDRILLNAQGGLQADNEILSYSGTQWEASGILNWNGSEGMAYVTALHPVYPDLTYTEKNLYESGTLQDVLFVSEEFPARQAIHLRFKHLFSSLTLQLSGALQEDFQKLEVHCPVVVSAVDASTAQVSLNYDKGHTTSIVQPDASGIYSLIVPPAKDMPVTVTIHTSDKVYTTQLPTRSFVANQDYRYKIKVQQQGPGIATAEDWIAFSVLTNGQTEYNGKTLKDFGETIDGVTTYRLLNDIDFEGVDCSDLLHIGKDKNGFGDIFDGQGYTLSNLPLKISDKYIGVFGYINKNGIVKNLHAKACNAKDTKETEKIRYAGVIAGSNLGIILDCSVDNCSLTVTQKTTHMGGIAGSSQNMIANCYVQNSVLDSYDSVGGISGYNSGDILNCFSAYNRINSRSNYGGGICGRTETSTPNTYKNCYIHSVTLRNNSKHGLIIGEARLATVTHCFYPFSNNINLTGNYNSENKVSGNFTYNTDFTETESGTPIYELLNQWIDTEAPTLYPDFTFTRWTDGGSNLPAVFIKE